MINPFRYGFSTRKLGELCAIQIGKTPARKESRYWGPGFPWLSIADMNQGQELDWTSETITESAVAECNCKPVPAGTVLMSFKLSIGKVGITQREMFTNEAIAALPIKDKSTLDKRYLVHFLANADFSGGAGANRAVMGVTLNKTSLNLLNVPVPPLDEQRRIAVILDKADAIRRQRREAIALTEELLQSAFDRSFGNPRDNPHGFPLVPMRRLVQETQYGTSSKANEEGRGLPVLRMGNVTADGRVDLTSLKWVELEASEVDKYTVRRGDLMFNRTNSPDLVGKTAVWHSDEVYALAGYLFRVRFDPEKADPDYVSGFLNSPYGKQYLYMRAKPSNNMSNFSASEFNRIPILLPSIEAQRDYAAFCRRIRRTRSEMEAALATADNLFNALVQRAFRGEL